LDLFGKIWEAAEPEERKELMRLFVHRLIYTPSEVRLGLHMEVLHAAHSAQPEEAKPGGRSAVGWQNWLPVQNTLAHRNRERRRSDAATGLPGMTCVCRGGGSGSGDGRLYGC